MVGGLADWFAVTALFRHPLGIPIPHTAIVPRKKDQIGAALASFVEQNFLTAEVVGERLATVEVPRRLGEWLSEPRHAARLAEELGAAVAQAAGLLRDDELRDAVTSFIDRKLHEVALAPVLARTVDAVCDSGQHQVALTAGLRGLTKFLEENRAVFRQRVAEESPEWVPNWVDERVFNRAFVAVQDFLADLINNADHELRHQFDKKLRSYAQELRTNPVAAAHAEETKAHLLDAPEMHDWLLTVWTHLRSAVVTGSTQPRSELQRTVASVAVQIGEALRSDTELRHKVDGWISSATTFVLTRYSDDIAGIISSTIERWDSDETGRRIEVQVGRDLQFIRVNGTVVGALVGVLIYTVGRVI
jgi:uncharacterized membrane-anchored protein YjiN (DUF445 family)